MDTPEFAVDGALLRMDDGVLELFISIALGSYRVPARWAGVSLESKKGDIVRVRIGLLPNDSQPFYNSTQLMSGGIATFEMPSADEPRLREFLDDVKRQGGRAS